MLPSAAAAEGSFRSDDALLNRIWAVSVSTARAMVVPGPLRADARRRPCAIELKTVIVDGAERDRCPYVGDLAVTGDTLLLAGPADVAALRAMILWFAQHQHRDGAIPASPLRQSRLVLFDYNALWVDALHDFVLSTGDLVLARQVWPSLKRLLDRWYTAQLGPRGLLVNRLGAKDYAYIHRRGTVIAYFNAGYARALDHASALAHWLRENTAAAAWTARARALARPFQNAFWDARAGAYRDSPTGTLVHPQDGNAFAILAGLATPGQSRSALDYLSRATGTSYGNTIADNDAWNYPRWGGLAGKRVYPFVGYFEVLARYAAGMDDSALELIRREWGYMVANGPQQGMWETIGPNGGGPIDGSWNHGWSSGAAPALTAYVLGVRPAAPGFATFVAEPHPSDLEWAKGDVPTPKGNLHLEWARAAAGFSVAVVSPVPGKIVVPLTGRLTLLDHRRVRATAVGGKTTFSVGRGTHTVAVVR